MSDFVLKNQWSSQPHLQACLIHLLCRFLGIPISDPKPNLSTYTTKAKPGAMMNFIRLLITPFEKRPKKLRLKKRRSKTTLSPIISCATMLRTENQRKLRDQITGNWEDCSYSESGLFTFNREQKDSVAITRHVRTAERILDKLYRTGIIQLADEHEDKPSDFEITLIQNKKARDIELGNLRAIKEAYAYAEQKLANADAVDEDFLLEVMSNCLEQNVFYDDEKSKIDLEEQLSTIGKTKGRVQKDEKIISRGDIVDASRIRKLQSLEYEFEKQLGGSKDATLILIGQILIVAICVFAPVYFPLFVSERGAGSKQTHSLLAAFDFADGFAR